MAMDFYKNNEFYSELISQGSFYDEDGPAEAGYLIRVFVVRLTPSAVNEYLAARRVPFSDEFETQEEYRESCEKRAFYKKARALFASDPSRESFSLAQNVCEIFTVVCMEEVKTKEEK